MYIAISGKFVEAHALKVKVMHVAPSLTPSITIKKLEEKKL
jgi:hypothetical protein